MEKFWKIKNEAEAENAEIYLYGTITTEKDWWTGEKLDEADKGAMEFAAELKSLGGKNVTLRINSPGGDVFQAQAMYNQIKAYSGTVNTVIDGMCASAATLVALAGNKICMPKNGIFMVHNPSVCYAGVIDKDKCNKINNMLEATRQTIVNVYMDKCKNLSETQVKHMMDAETWMSADECLKNGFIDEIVEDVNVENATYLSCVAYAKDNYSNYAYVCDNKGNGCGKIENEVNVKEVENVNDTSWLEDLKSMFKAKNNVDDAVKAERERINLLNRLRNGNEAVNKIVDIAIEKGNTAEQVQEFVDAVSGVKPKNDGIEEIKAIVMDQKNSGADNVVVNAAEGTPKADNTATGNASDVDKLAKYMKAYADSKMR